MKETKLSEWFFALLSYLLLMVHCFDIELKDSSVIYSILATPKCIQLITKLIIAFAIVSQCIDFIHLEQFCK